MTKDYAVCQTPETRLIEAAPDLLKACVKMVIWHGKRDFKDDLLPIQHQKAEIAEAMEAIEMAGFKYHEWSPLT